MTSDISRELREVLTGRVCVVGIGNRLRGDDGAGPRVIAQRQAAAAGVWIDAGVTPENYLEPIARVNADVVLIIDAVNFGGVPGECRLLDANTTDVLTLSTHTGSISMLCEYLSARTRARLLFLGIQPSSINHNADLSQSVANTVRVLAALLSDLLSSD